jgi:uncharacterized protein
MHESLSAAAVRVLGALLEKSMSTPENYPMTLNALRNACNQKSNRDPVVTFSETDVVTALDELQHAGLTGHVSGGGSRAMKYRHALAEKWHMSAEQCAVLSCLFVRGAQTIGEIKGRTGRLFSFNSLSDVDGTLTSLREREPPLVSEVARRPGQKEVRYTHLLAGGVISSEATPSASTTYELSAPSDPFPINGEDLRAELDELHAEVSRLRKDFEMFREQFD